MSFIHLKSFVSSKSISLPIFQRLRYSVPLACLLIISRSLAAQQPAASSDSSSVPATGAKQQTAQSDAPNGAAAQNSAQTSPQTSADDKPAAQTSRILDVIPNFRAVSAGQQLPKQSVKEKFMTTTEDSFDYSSVFIPAVLAGYSMARNATPEFHQGAAGYARYFWHSAVDQTSENYMVEFIVPVITHEDTRYYTMGSGGFLKRTGYALSRAVITRSDSGKEVFNLSEVVGSGASSGLSSLYYPSRERSLANTGEEWGLDIGIDAAAMFAKEFWPDVNRCLFHGGRSTGQSAQ
jgi:hypothetical protein